MPIPDYQTLMLPLLLYGQDGKEHSLREAIEHLAGKFHLSDDERKELLPSGRQEVLDNRVGWARTYLKKAGLVEMTRRGYFRITPQGKQVLSEKPDQINVKYLDQFPEFQDFRALRHTRVPKDGVGPEDTDLTPEEALETAYKRIRDNLASDIFQQLRACSPSLFERIVVELLVKMGYGGSRQDAGKAVGKSGDEGIDGIIKEDRLGLDIIYIQAKRWGTVVGRPEVQKFAGALQGQRARKGIMITTSTFTKEAQEYVSKIDSKIVLLDGVQIANLMIDNNIGISTLTNYEIKRVDSDYFNDE